NGRGHPLSNRHFEDLDVVTELLETQIVKLSEVSPQVLGKIRLPSRLKNPDGLPGLEAIRFDQTVPQVHETVRREGSRFVIGGDNSIATGKHFEILAGSLERNRLLLAQVVTENKIALVVREDQT